MTTRYVTTPIYYPSGQLHIGHAYTTTAGDALARYWRCRGHDVRYVTGTDEHGQKIERVAAQHGVAPQAYVDHIVEGIQALWAKLHITHDDFIRTTQSRHRVAVARIFQQLIDQGDIYLGTYEGWYCTHDEAFFTERQLLEGHLCPDCGRPVERVQETCYFFRLQKYAQRLLDHYEAHPDFVLPQSCRHEMLQNFLLAGLDDLAVSRTTFSWGIPVPDDPKHVIYVWIDALTNYITALGYGSEDAQLFDRYWPADVHLVGKEIARFHAITWPIVLMALHLPLPKCIFAHGWLLMKDGKMSKSKGNVVDPHVLIDRYGVDAVRYFLLREVPFGSDGTFTPEAFVGRINADIVNDLGNLLQRTLSMIEKYVDGHVPHVDMPQSHRTLAMQTIDDVERHCETLQFSLALQSIWTFVRAMNKMIETTQPWVLAKEHALEAQLHAVLRELVCALRCIAGLLQPFFVHIPRYMMQRLGYGAQWQEDIAWDRLRLYDAVPPGLIVQRGDMLMARLDVPTEVAYIAQAMHKP